MEVVLWRHTHMPLYTRIAETEKKKNADSMNEMRNNTKSKLIKRKRNREAISFIS